MIFQLSYPQFSNASEVFLQAKFLNSKTSGYSLKLYKQSSRLDVTKYSFGFRTVTSWNSLPNDVVTAENTKLDKYLIKHKYTLTNELISGSFLLDT